MYPDDILLWPDGFWCFREEYAPTFLREDNYRVVKRSSYEWRALEAKRPVFQKEAAG